MMTDKLEQWRAHRKANCACKHPSAEAIDQLILDAERAGRAIHNTFCVNNAPMHSASDHSGAAFVRAYLQGNDA